MIKLKKLQIKMQAKENLPLFYNFIVYNEMIEKSESLSRFKYDKQLDSRIFFEYPEKPISKILNPEKK